MKILLPIPYISQTKTSANCGPCSLKMILDYYQPIPTSVSVHALNRMLRVSSQWGTDFKNIPPVLKRFGLQRTRINSRKITTTLRAGLPILCAFMDETNSGHYAVIVGMRKEGRKTILIFNDPYFGRHYKRPLHTFKMQLRRFKDWMWAISNETHRF